MLQQAESSSSSRQTSMDHFRECLVLGMLAALKCCQNEFTIDFLHDLHMGQASTEKISSKKCHAIEDRLWGDFLDIF